LPDFGFGGVFALVLSIRAAITRLFEWIIIMCVALENGIRTLGL